MEVKKNLNNVQRKMLDEIYTTQFEKRADLIREERAKGLSNVKKELLKKKLTEKDVKKMMEAGKLFYQMADKLAPKLKEVGLSIAGVPTKEPCVEYGYNYYSSSPSGDFKEITVYNDKTREIELNLGEKKKEMRAKIYGVAASYEEVDQEIKELLKDV